MQTDLELYNYRPAKRDEDGCRRCRTCEHCYFYLDKPHCNHVMAREDIQLHFVCDYYDYNGKMKIGECYED